MQASDKRCITRIICTVPTSPTSKSIRDLCPFSKVRYFTNNLYQKIITLETTQKEQTHSFDFINNVPYHSSDIAHDPEFKQ